MLPSGEKVQPAGLPVGLSQLRGVLVISPFPGARSGCPQGGTPTQRCNVIFLYFLLLVGGHSRYSGIIVTEIVLVLTSFFDASSGASVAQ